MALTMYNKYLMKFLNKTFLTHTHTQVIIMQCNKYRSKTEAYQDTEQTQIQKEDQGGAAVIMTPVTLVNSDKTMALNHTQQGRDFVFYFVKMVDIKTNQ